MLFQEAFIYLNTFIQVFNKKLAKIRKVFSSGGGYTKGVRVQPIDASRLGSIPIT